MRSTPSQRVAVSSALCQPTERHARTYLRPTQTSSGDLEPPDFRPNLWPIDTGVSHIARTHLRASRPPVPEVLQQWGCHAAPISFPSLSLHRESVRQPAG